MSVCSITNKTSYHSWDPSGTSVTLGTANQVSLDTGNSPVQSELNVYSLNFNNGVNFQLSNSTETGNRFQSLTHTQGTKNLIIGGLSNGSISIFDKNGNLQHNLESAHTGATRSVDANRFKPHLICSGGLDSEVYIWDLTNLTADMKPMAPGPKTTPLTPVSAVSWNYQVEHILASGSGAQGGGVSPCTVWDLRRNKPIINVQDSTGRVQCSSLAWNPNVATQIAIASEDDISPVVQLWDLRQPQSPLSSMNFFQKGVSDIQFCPFDDRLMLTSSKDNTIRVINFGSGSDQYKCVYEQQLIGNYPFCARWCTNRNTPDLVSVSAYDGTFDVYSIQGQGKMPTNRERTTSAMSDQSNAITDAFGISGSDSPFGASSEKQATKPTKISEIPINKISIQPKWLAQGRARCSFGFGGKLVTIKHRREIEISQLSSDNLLKSRALDLIEALKSEITLKEFCAKNGESNSFWKYLGARLSGNKTLIHELGYDTETVTKTLNKILEQKKKTEPVNAEDLTRRLSSALRASPNSSDAISSMDNNQNFTEDQTLPTFLRRPSAYPGPSSSSQRVDRENLRDEITLANNNNDQPGPSHRRLIGRAQNNNDRQDNNESDPISEDEINSDDDLNITTNEEDNIQRGNDNNADNREQEEATNAESRDSACVSPKLLLPQPTKPEQSVDGVLCQALLLGKLEQAVELCITEKRWPEAFVLAEKAGGNIFEETKKRFLSNNNNARLGRLLSAVTLGDWQHLVEWISVEQWREALVALLTYEDQLSHNNQNQIGKNQKAKLVEKIAERMTQDHTTGLSAEAEYCLVAGADVDVITKHLLITCETKNEIELAQLVEKCCILRKCLDGQCSELEADILLKYVLLLSDNGLLDEAYNLIPDMYNCPKLKNMKDRLQRSMAGPDSLFNQKQQHQQQQNIPPQQNFGYNNPTSNNMSTSITGKLPFNRPQTQTNLPPNMMNSNLNTTNQISQNNNTVAFMQPKPVITSNNSQIPSFVPGSAPMQPGSQLGGVSNINQPIAQNVPVQNMSISQLPPSRKSMDGTANNLRRPGRNQVKRSPQPGFMPTPMAATNQTPAQPTFSPISATSNQPNIQSVNSGLPPQPTNSIPKSNGFPPSFPAAGPTGNNINNNMPNIQNLNMNPPQQSNSSASPIQPTMMNPQSSNPSFPTQNLPQKTSHENRVFGSKHGWNDPPPKVTGGSGSKGALGLRKTKKSSKVSAPPSSIMFTPSANVNPTSGFPGQIPGGFTPQIQQLPNQVPVQNNFMPGVPPQTHNINNNLPSALPPVTNAMPPQNINNQIISDNTKPHLKTRKNSFETKQNQNNMPIAQPTFQPNPNALGPGGSFPGFSSQQQKLAQNAAITKEAFKNAAGPPPKDVMRPRSNSKMSHSEKSVGSRTQSVDEINLGLASGDGTNEKSDETVGESNNDNNNNNSDIKNFSQEHEASAEDQAENNSDLSPEEQQMKNTFSTLLNNCKSCERLTGPFKRKLDDVDRRLNILWEKMNTGELSQSVVDQLISMGQLANSKNYMGAIDIHKQIIQSANFSQISAFMPGLKVLLQICFQLKL